MLTVVLITWSKLVTWVVNVLPSICLSAFTTVAAICIWFILFKQYLTKWHTYSDRHLQVSKTVVSMVAILSQECLVTGHSFKSVSICLCVFCTQNTIPLHASMGPISIVVNSHSKLYHRNALLLLWLKVKVVRQGRPASTKAFRNRSLTKMLNKLFCDSLSLHTLCATYFVCSVCKHRQSKTGTLRCSANPA